MQDGSGYAVVTGQIDHGGRKVAEAEIRYGVAPFPNETLRAQMLETARRVGGAGGISAMTRVAA